MTQLGKTVIVSASLTTLINVSVFFLYTWYPAKFEIVPSRTIGNIKPGILPTFSDAKMSSGKMKIPKILHQTWKNRDSVPPKYARYRKMWLKMHPGWSHHLWTDEENRELVRIHYPWLLQAYDAFPVGIHRADTSHYLQMHQYGGLYADLDMEPLRPLDFLLDNATEPVTMGYMRRSFKDISNIQPGFIISEPGHPIWLYTALRILCLFQHLPSNTRPDYITGPIALYDSILDYQRAHMDASSKARLTGDKWQGARKPAGSIKDGSDVVYELRMLRPGLIYPYHWSEGNTKQGKFCNFRSASHNETACKAFFPNAYTLQYSGCSWCNNWEGYLKKEGYREVGTS